MDEQLALLVDAALSCVGVSPTHAQLEERVQAVYSAAAERSEEQELAAATALLQGGLVRLALGTLRQDQRAWATVRARSYREGALLVRVPLLQGDGFEVRVHVWNQVPADETFWHEHQYSIVVQCLAGRGYQQLVGAAVADPEGQWVMCGRFACVCV